LADGGWLVFSDAATWDVASAPVVAAKKAPAKSKKTVAEAEAEIAAAEADLNAAEGAQ
jgi:hypothetical protein